MAAEQPAPSRPRQDRRRAETRRRIVSAADKLFGEQGYAETSIDDIAAAADVAVRTIYLHFESKAAIMLTYFDDWLDDFVAAVIERPLSEPVVETVRSALVAMGERGWSERVEGAGQRPHPVVEYLDSGSLDVAGHVMHRWMGAMSRLAQDAVGRGETAEGDLGPHARSVAIFSVWISAVFVAGEKQRGVAVPDDVAGSSPGLAILERITSGRL